MSVEYMNQGWVDGLRIIVSLDREDGKAKHEEK